MAWKEDINTPLRITTGDGTVFTVGWQPDGLVEEYNIANFDFNNIPGSLEKKGMRKGRKYPFRFFFQGDDHIQDMNAFLASASDTRPMLVQHPLYGNITCQVASFNIDHTKLNVSEITCTLLETITEDTPAFTQDPVDKISNDKAVNDEAFVSAFDVTPSSGDINTMTGTNNQLYSKGKKIGSTETYFNLFTDANTAVVNATADPIAAVRKTQALINAPANFATGVKDRIGTLTDQFSTLRGTLSTITGKSGKKVYEAQGAALISAMALAASTPLASDYSSKNDVLAVISPITDSYSNYIADLDSKQTDNGGSPKSYIPDPTGISGLHSLVNFTVSQLFTIALGAKQERSFYLEDDSNWVVLAHRLYGISADDHEVQLLIDQNGGGLSEMLGVKKGRRLVYYV